MHRYLCSLFSYFSLSLLDSSYGHIIFSLLQAVPSLPVETSSTQYALTSPSQGKPTLHPVTQTRPLTSPPLSPSLCWVCLLHSSWSLPLLPAHSSLLCLGDRSSPQPPSHWAPSTPPPWRVSQMPVHRSPSKPCKAASPPQPSPGLQLPDCAQGFIHAFSSSLLSLLGMLSPLSGTRVGWVPTPGRHFAPSG